MILHSCSSDEKLTANDSTTVSRSNSSCFNDSNTVGNCINGTFVYPIQIPEYPGCTFIVSIEYTQCNVGPYNLRYYFNDIEIIDFYCPAYLTDLSNAITNGNESIFMSTFFHKITVAFNNLLINNLSSSINQVITFEYNIESCTKTCVGNTVGSKESQTGWWAKRVACGENCCKRQIEYRRDLQGNLYEYSYSASAAWNSCIPIEEIPCPRFTIYTIGCNFNCQ